MVNPQCVKKRSADGTRFGGQHVLAFAAPESAQGWYRTAHARAKGDAADQAAQAACQESDLARAVARELSPSFHQPGPDYLKQRFNDTMEIKEAPEEKIKENPPPSPSDSPHFYRKGTTPPRSPQESPRTTPSSKSGSRSSVRQEAPPKPVKKVEPAHNPTTSGNGQLHSQYHSYLVKTDMKLPAEELEDVDYNVSHASLGRHLPPPKQSRAPPAKSLKAKQVAKESKPEQKLKKQESSKPKSLSETKKASIEVTSEIIEVESVSIHLRRAMKASW
ncbi:JPH1 protein, partial [Polyodon spathula]|nr:JPH1 protein [Polyodon spathula]